MSAEYNVNIQITIEVGVELPLDRIRAAVVRVIASGTKGGCDPSASPSFC